MRKVLLLASLLSFAFLVKAQNLVLNPSFENNSACPQGISEFGIVVTNWSTPDTATPDYFNSCYNPFLGLSVDVPNNFMGHQAPRTGDAYAGIISEDIFPFPPINANYREYLQGQLSSPLVSGQQYCVSFYWNLGDKSTRTVQNIGVYFSNTQVNLQQSTTLPFTPQVSTSGTFLNDTVNWVLFKQEFVASGGEQYFMIGNFNTPGNTVSMATGVPYDPALGSEQAYYYIEDVSVTPGSCCIAQALSHPAVCTSDQPFNLSTSTPGGTWSGPGITNATSGLFDPSASGPGSHTITYSLSCGSSSTITMVVTVCAALDICVENNGDLTVSGGTGPYTWAEADTMTDCSACLFPFLCAPPGCAVIDTTWTQFTTGTTATPPSGWLGIRVTDSQSNTVTLTDLSGLPSCSGCAITAQIVEESAVLCFGGNTGSATVAAQNANGNVTYAWSTNPVQTGTTASGLTAGTYTVTVTDASQCSNTTSVIITGPAAALSASLTPTNPSCSTPGSISVSASGGTSGYTYLWSEGAQTGTSINNLSAGTYTVTVTDQNACTVVQNTTLTGSGSQPQASVDEQQNVLCNGDSTGWVSIGVTGGTPNYTITWNTTPAQTGALASNLPAGTYTASISDQNNCATTISVDITEPQELQLSTSSTTSQCGLTTGTATVNASGGAGGYSYLWDNNQTGGTASNLGSGNYTVTVTDASQCTATANVSVSDANGPSISISAQQNPACAGGADGTASALGSGGSGNLTYSWNTNPVQTGNTATNLPAGTYTCTVFDAGGCQSSATVTLTEPIAVSATAAASNPGCGAIPDGSVAVTPTGGAGQYTYLWSNSQTASSITGLGAGTYTCTITDQVGCTTVVTETLDQPTPLIVNPTVNDATCEESNGSILLNPMGGSGQYTYSWCNNGGTASSLNNIPAGHYCVTIDDGSGCEVDTTIVVASTNTLDVTITSDTNNVLTATSNTPGTSYQWYYNGQLISGATGPTYTITESGTYYVVGTTKEGCEDQSNTLELSVLDGIEEEMLQDLNIYPNPATHQLMVVGDLVAGKTLMVEIYAATGQLVYTNEYNSLSGNIVIPVYQYSEGIYLMKLAIDANVRLEKVVIKK